MLHKQSIIYIYISYSKPFKDVLNPIIKHNEELKNFQLKDLISDSPSYQVFIQQYKGKEFYNKSKEEKIRLYSFVKKSEKILELKIYNGTHTNAQQSCKTIVNLLRREFKEIDIKSTCFRKSEDSPFVLNVVVK